MWRERPAAVSGLYSCGRHGPSPHSSSSLLPACCFNFLNATTTRHTMTLGRSSVAAVLLLALSVAARPVDVDQQTLRVDDQIVELTAEYALVSPQAAPPVKLPAPRHHRRAGRAAGFSSGIGGLRSRRCASRQRAAGGALRWHPLACPPPHLLPAPSLLLFLQTNPAEAFSLWQATHGKSYKSAGEGARRQAVFADNARRVAAQNARSDSSLRLALNPSADLPWPEFAQSRLGYSPALR